MLDGDGEEALDGGGVEINGHETLDRTRLEQVGQDSGSEGLPRARASVLSGVPEVGDERGDPPGAGAMAGIGEQGQLEQMLVGGRARRLQQVHVVAAHALLQFDLQFAVGKGLDPAFAEVDPKILDGARGEIRIRGSGEDRERCRHGRPPEGSRLKHIVDAAGTRREQHTCMGGMARCPLSPSTVTCSVPTSRGSPASRAKSFASSAQSNDEPTGDCRLKKAGRQGGPLSQLLERVSEEALDTKSVRCHLCA